MNDFTPETLIRCTRNEIHIGIMGIYYTYYKVFTADHLVWSYKVPAIINLKDTTLCRVRLV